MNNIKSIFGKRAIDLTGEEIFFLQVAAFKKVIDEQESTDQEKVYKPEALRITGLKRTAFGERIYHPQKNKNGIFTRIKEVGSRPMFLKSELEEFAKTGKTSTKRTPETA